MLAYMADWIALQPIGPSPKAMTNTACFSRASRMLFKQATGHVADAWLQNTKSGILALRARKAILGKSFLNNKA